MDLAAISAAVETRATSDVAAGGLFEVGAGLINSIAFDSTLGGEQPPLVIVSFPSSTQDDTFPTDAIDVTIDFEIIVPRKFGTFADDSAILGRIKTLYHRWQMTLSGASATLMGRVDGQTNHDEINRRYIELYSVRVEEA